MKNKSPRRVFLRSGAAALGVLSQANFSQAIVPGADLVRVATPLPDLAHWISHATRPWARRNGLRVEVALTAPGNGPDPLTGADLWLIPPRSLAALAGHASPIPADIISRSELAWPDFLPVWRERLGRWRSAQVAAPLAGDLWVQLTRSDWLADERLKNLHNQATGRPLRAPRFWEEWVDLGRALHGELPGLKGQPVLPPLPAKMPDQLRLLRQVAAGHAVERLAAGQRLPSGSNSENNHYALDFDLQTGQPRCAGKAFVHALDWLTRLKPYQPPAQADQPWDAFAQGKAMVCLAPATQIGFLQRDSLRDRFDIHPLPSADRVYLDTGTLVASQGNFVPLVGSEGALALAPREAGKAAWLLLEFLLSPRVMLDLVLDPHVGGPVREQHLQAAPWDGMQLDNRRLTQWRETLRMTLSPGETVNPVIALRTPDAPGLDLALGEQVALALTGTGKPAACLELAAVAWKKLGQARPDRLAEVRASMGLS